MAEHDDTGVGGSRTLAGYRRHVTVLTIAFFVLCLTWAVSTPYFDGPDERQHHNSVVRVARGLGWPKPYDAPMLAATRHTAIEARAAGTDLAKAPPRPSPSKRSRLVDPGSLQDAGVDQMVQHPPGYYLLAAAPVKALGVGSIRWDLAATVMRTTSALLLAAALPAMIGTVSRLTRDQLAGLIGGTAIVGIPFFANMGGFISNDNLLVSAVSIALYGAVRLATEADSPRWLPAATGAALGVALFSKGYALLAVPAVVLLGVLAVIRRPASRRLRFTGELGLGALLALAFGGWWWIRNLLVLGKIQPSRITRYTSADPTHPDYSFAGFLTGSADRLQSTFWGRGVKAGIALPPSLTWFASAVLLALVAIGLVWGRRRLETLILLSVPALIAATFLSNGHRIYRVVTDELSGIRGVQGRYLYAGLVGIAVGIGWATVVIGRRIGGRARGVLVPIVLIAPWVSALGGLAWSVGRHRSASLRTVFAHDVRDWIGLPLTQVLAVICLALAVTAIVGIRRDLREVPDGDHPLESEDRIPTPVESASTP